MNQYQKITFVIVVILVAVLAAISYGPIRSAAMTVFGTEIPESPVPATETDDILPEPEPKPPEPPDPFEKALSEVNTKDAKMLAKMMYGEAAGVISKDERAATGWIVLNRIDDPKFKYAVSVETALTGEGQFKGYRESNPVTDECLALAKDVLARYALEKEGLPSGRVIPSDYLFFSGDGEKNYFKNRKGDIWDFSLESPYSD
jgi:hypothetical protein